MDLPRPRPVQPFVERVASLVRAVSPARLATASASMVVLAVGAWWLLQSPPLPVEQGLTRAPTATSTAPSGPTSVAANEITVQIAGGVRQPGVYRLGVGSRVVDLVAAAGGTVDGVDRNLLALASKLSDGQRIGVPGPGETTVSGTPTLGIEPGAPVVVDLNAATVADLDTLPGVGPATAAAIIAFRGKRGRFSSVDELLDVPGIGPAKLEAFRDLVRV